MTFTNRQRVRIINPKTLPSGKSIQLVALIDFENGDGTYNVRVCTPGMFGGAILRNIGSLELEAVA